MVTTRSKEYQKPATPAAKKPSTPNRPAKVSDDSTPGESSRTSRKHIRAPLLEDIEANGGLQKFLGKKNKALDRLLNRLVQEDLTGGKAALYGRSFQLDPQLRGSIQKTVWHWKEIFKDGKWDQYLEENNVVPFSQRPQEKPTPAKQLQFKSSNSTISSGESDDLSEEDSIESERPPSVIRDPKTQAKKEQKQLNRGLKSPPAVVKASSSSSSTSHPCLPSEITVNINRLQILEEEPDSPAKQAKITPAVEPPPTEDMSLRGLTADNPILYDPNNLNPLQYWPLYIMKCIDIEGVGEFQYSNYSGFVIKVKIDPKFTSDNNNKMNSGRGSRTSEFYRCRLIKKNLIKLEVPLQDYLLLKEPQQLNIAPEASAAYKGNVMRAFYTANVQYQQLMLLNYGRDPVLEIYLKFPDSCTISAKHVNRQSAEDEDQGHKTISPYFDFGTHESTASAPLFRNTNYYAYYMVADILSDKSDKSKTTLPAVAPPTISDVTNALAGL